MVATKPNVQELRRIRATYFGQPHAEKARIITPKSAIVPEASTQTVSDGLRRHRKRKHVSVSSARRKRGPSEAEVRTEDFVYGLGPRDQAGEEMGEIKDDTEIAPRSTHRHGHSRPKVPHRHSLPIVPESEVGPDDSISVVAERRHSASYRSSRPSVKRSTTSSRLDSIPEKSPISPSTVSFRRSSRRESTLLGYRRHSTTSIPSQPVLIECLTCASDDVPVSQSARLACGHRMCHTCLKRVFEMSVKDPAHMPPRCCTDEHIPLSHVDRLFDLKFKLLWNRKYQEYNTKDRIYCPTPRCGHWIRPSHIHTYQGRKFAQCSRCKTKVCTLCNNKLHKLQECPQDPEIAKLVAQAKENGWQRCFSCNAMVELKEGCNHMTCRCTAEFCMVCGSEWKTCDCPWFNYTNLPNPDRLNEMRVPEPIQILYRRVFDAARPQPVPPPNEEAVRDRTYAQEIENRRRQERLDADLARRMQLASLFDPDDRPRARRREDADGWGLGNVAGHFMNDDFVQNAVNVVMNGIGDANMGRRGERSSGRRRRARQTEQKAGVDGLVPNFLGDESVLGTTPAAPPRSR